MRPGGDGKKGRAGLVGMPQLTQPFTDMLEPGFVLSGGFLGRAGSTFLNFSLNR